MIWSNFKRIDFQCRCGCKSNKINADFVDRLQKLRDRFAKPVIITSGYRCPKHDRSEQVRGGGAHVSGHAADVAVRGRAAVDFLRIALDCGFTGIGLKQHGENRFIHLDDLRDDWPRPMIWTYE